MKNKRRIALVFLIALAAGFSLGAQELETAFDYFDRVSERYGTIKDYTADITISQSIRNGEDLSQGRIFYKAPNLLRIDFSVPRDQVIVVDDKTLQIFLPRHDVVMVQALRQHNDASLAAMANSQGLALMKKGYSIGYLDSPAPVPLDEGSEEMVVKLRLEWRSTEQGYRQLILSIGEDLLIKRIEGITPEYSEVSFNFSNIRINQNIPETRFEYEPPASAYEIENFLFEPED